MLHSPASHGAPLDGPEDHVLDEEPEQYHREQAREYLGNPFGGIEVEEEVIHTLADGRRFLVLHGDKFDTVVRYARWLAVLGDSAYAMSLAINAWFNAIRRRLGFPYWSLSQWAKLKESRAAGSAFRTGRCRNGPS